MKKLYALIGLYLFLLSTNISCQYQHYLITDIRFESATLEYTGSDIQHNYYIYTSIFIKDIVFIISYHTEYIAYNSLNLNSNCYALTKGRIMNNSLLDSTFSIKFNRPFVYKFDTIKANQNIIQNISIKKEIQIFESYMAFHNNGGDKVFSFSDSFIKNAKFDTLVYKVTFNCMTSDSLVFNKEITVKFKIK